MENIIKWIENSIESKAWERFDDIHLDELDNSIDSKEWISKGLYFLKKGNELIGEDNTYQLVLSITLECVLKPPKKEMKSIEEIKEHMDVNTPPSLYLFPMENQAFKKTLERCSILRIRDLVDHRFYYQELIEESEYYRTIFILKNLR
ncbi:MAG: hypothetical protein AAGA02_16050 [Bacteroidota bacterium]